RPTRPTVCPLVVVRSERSRRNPRSVAARRPVASKTPVAQEAMFPDLARERARLAFARACRDRMIERLEAVDPQSAADEITADDVEVTVEEALESLRSPGAGEF